MRKHRQSAGANQVTNEINTLKDGVGRQAPSKRMPTEAEEIINCQVTLEQSIQKRPGLQAVLNVNNLTWDGEYDGETAPEIPTDGVYGVPGVDERINGVFLNNTWVQNVRYIWFELSSDNLFLIQILSSNNTWAQAVAGQQEVIKIVKINDDSTWTLQDTIVAGGPDITESGYNYLMYGSLNYGSRIKHVNAGADILLLNSEVYAGFSSTLDPSDNLWKLHGLSGVRTSTEDIKGRKVSYYPAGNRDTESESRVYQQDSFYFRGDRIWRPTNTNTSVTPNVLASWGAVYQALDDRDTTSSGQRPVAVTPVQNVDGTWSPPDIDLDPYGDGHSGRERHGWKLLRYLGDIEVEFNTNVEDLNNYPVGAAVNSFRDLPFPPRLGELNDLNFIWWYEFPGPYSAEYLAPIETIALLYDGWNGSNRRTDGTPTNGGSAGSPLGRGGLFYCKNAFLEALPGWYRAINTTVAPYYQRIRSPYPYGRFDENRMPHKLYRNSAGEWKLETVNWDMRLAGSDSDNPGPSAFKEGRQTPIRDIAVFQNRLYFAADDTVFSSRLGEFEDFFIADPGNITDSDPIDTTLSTNSYAEVEYMIPFRDQLFIVTNASTQFILTGFDNVVSPFTVEIQPISFYTTSGVTNPVTVGNSVYFANNRRMYMYYPQNVEAGMTVEMTKHCPDYLPEYPTGLYTATANDMMFISSPNDSDNSTYPHELFCYVNRYSSNQMVQNALHKWVLDSPDTSGMDYFSKNRVAIKSAYAKENYLYIVYYMNSSQNDGLYGTYLGRVFLNNADEKIPRLDNYFQYTQTGPPSNIYYTVPETEVGASGYNLFSDESTFLNSAGSFVLQENFPDNIPLIDPVPQNYEFESGISIETQVYVNDGFINEYPKMRTSPNGPKSAGKSGVHLSVYGGDELTVPARTYAIRLKIPTLSNSVGFYLSGYDGPELSFVRFFNNGNLVSEAPLSVSPGIVNPPQFYGIVFPYVNGVATQFDTVEIFIPSNLGSTEFDVVGIDNVIYGGGPGLGFMNDKDGFLNNVGPLLLYEDFESYPFGLVDSPTTFSNSNITIESIMVVGGNSVVPTTSITGPTVFTVPSNGLKHYANYGPVFPYTWTLSVKLPAPTNNFGCYLSGSSRPYIETQLYKNNVQQAILTAGPFGEEYGPAEFVGFITPDTDFDEVRFIFPPIPGSGSFDSIGIDEITVSYSTSISTGLTWFCVPYGIAGLDTVWLGSGWGVDSYKALPIVQSLGRLGLNKPSWVAVEGNYSAPLANIADGIIAYVVNNLEDLDDFENVVVDELALVLTENAVYKFVGSWILNNTRTWVDYGSGSPVNLSAEVAFGRRYLMDIELSQQFIRDQQNNVIEGVLSLRQLVLRHKNTAEYSVQIYSENDKLRSFTNFKEPKGIVSTPNLLKVPLDTSGELVAKILGFSETSKIKITSDSVLPVNITNMTIRGKFRRKNSTFLS